MTGATEDAASVLEQFTHDAANLPGEIAHLLEEIHAKDQLIAEYRTTINNKDNALQKWVKANGFGCIKHPKEDIWAKQVASAYDRAQALQDEKCALANKCGFLLDRQVKRLDLKIQDLQADSNMPYDPDLPSLLHETRANLVGPASSSTTATNTGFNTPSLYQPMIYNINNYPIISNGVPPAGPLNAAVARMAHQANSQSTQAAPVPGMQSFSGSGASQHLVPPQREGSIGTASNANETLRHRRQKGALGTLAIPTASSAQVGRHSSLGPKGTTPKAGTPQARAGSAGPRLKNSGASTTLGKKSGLQQSLGTKKKTTTKKKKKDAKRLTTGNKGTPSTTGEDESEVSEESGEEEEGTTGRTRRGGSAASAPVRSAKDGGIDELQIDEARKAAKKGQSGYEEEAGDDGTYDEEGDDNRLYCVCHSVSHGDMVACDNDDCRFEWFHWSCVGLTEEPRGRWLCPECRKLPEGKINLAR